MKMTYYVAGILRSKAALIAAMERVACVGSMRLQLAVRHDGGHGLIYVAYVRSRLPFACRVRILRHIKRSLRYSTRVRNNVANWLILKHLQEA